MNTVVCNPVGAGSVLSGSCSANIGASIDIKQVSCSMACKVTVWRWQAVWRTISLGNHMFRYGSAFFWLHGVVVIVSCANQAQLQTDLLADLWHPQFYGHLTKCLP